jgi:hypothetical protein
MRGNVPWYLKYDLLFGFEESSEENEEEENQENEEKNEDEENEDEEGEKKEEKPDPAKGLKSALQAERRERKKLERENRKLLQAQKELDDKDASEVTKATKKAEALEGNVKNLAAKLRTTAVENQITRFAAELNFRDLGDALVQVDRSKIEVDQDETDPSDLEVDEASVKTAVEKLAKDKPYLLKADGDVDETGGNVGRKGKKDDSLSEQALRDKYPALRH